MSKEIIEFLKSNRVQYCLWTPEERAVADRIPRKWWLYYMTCDSGFANVSAQDTTLGDENDGCGIYRLKPDYEPEPENPWVEIMVVDRNGYWGIWKENHEAIDIFHRLDAMPGIIGYGGIVYEDCACERLKELDMHKDFLMRPPQPCEKHGPHKPVLVRFWRQKE